MDENLISNISYTSKDFNTIYPELLDLVKKLTNKWDPSLSNESDPGVLLLKLNAIIADKNNYNIDKNILECFPLSVTQEGNARRLYDMLGYTMHWYRSATTDVSFQLRSTENIPSEGYTIPQFTSLVDSTGESIYTILNNVVLTSAALNTPVTATAIEGVVYDYTIDNSDDTTLITIANLDNDLRLYFPDQMVAENGIFITDANNTSTYPTEYNGLSGVWHRVDNIASYPLGEYIYEFGVLPNSNTCYIQFPQDVASLIENGIRIKYTITKGAQGNIKANILSLFYEDQESSSDDSTDGDSVINEDIKILQLYPADNGEDPESIDEAYRNYKRTIGTFNTLVTERDYENFVYNLMGTGNKSLISNVVVSDRTDDINYSDYVQVWYPSGSRQELQIKNDQLNAYNIVLYLLKQPQSVYDKSTYDESFKLCTDNITMQDIRVSLEDSQSVQHDILFIPEDTLNSEGLIEGKKISIENTIALTGSLITYNKVSKAEASDIEKAVLSALYRVYNARNVAFGSQIEYEDLVSTIQNADSRIKTVVLNVPTYIPKYNVLLNNESATQYLDPNTFSYNGEQKVLNNELVARMIIAGNVQLFKFDTDFNYDFGQKDATIINTDGHEIIKSITSSTKIEVSKDKNEPTIIKENEVLQIIEPSLVTETEYSFVRYWLNTADTSYTIPAGRDTAIQYPLHLRYLDATTNAYINVVLQAGTIINSTTDIGYKPDTTETSYSAWNQLYSGNSIKVRKLNQSRLNIGTKYYFITNTSDNRLQITTDKSKILQENEYFIYTNSNTNELIIYGSGTELSIDKNSSATFDEHIDLLDLSEISSDNIENINWLTLTQDLYVTELKITNVASGSQIYAEVPSDETSPDSIIAENTSKAILNSDNKDYVTYHIIDDSDNVITIYPSIIQDSPNLIQSRLYINANQYSPQILSGDQSFKFTFVDVDEITGETIKDSNGEDITYESGEITNTQILFNNPVILSGGENIDVKVLDDYGQYLYSLKAMSYESVDVYDKDSLVPEGYTEPTDPIQRNTDGLIILNRTTLPKKDSSYDATVNLNFTFNQYSSDQTSYMIPIYVTLTTRQSAPFPTIQIVGVSEEGESNFTIYGGTNNTSPANFASSSSNALGRSYIIKSPATGCNSMQIRISNFGENDSLTIGSIFKLDGYNAEEINITDLNYTYDINTEADNVIKRIHTILDDPTIFNWTYIVPEIDKVLNPTLADSYWNENHIYNKYTIPKIDFSNTKIKINPSTIIQ